MESDTKGGNRDAAMHAKAAFGLSERRAYELVGVSRRVALAHSRVELAEWQHDYNTVRPHSKLGGHTPTEIAKQAAKQWKDSTSDW